jgi:hypothetical protein
MSFKDYSTLGMVCDGEAFYGFRPSSWGLDIFARDLVTIELGIRTDFVLGLRPVLVRRKNDITEKIF